MKEKIRFKDLSTLLKFAVIGGAVYGVILIGLIILFIFAFIGFMAGVIT